MKRDVRLYNVLFPVWILYFFPQLWVIVVPGNLVIDCLVLLLTLLALHHRDKKGVMKTLWWRFWLLGFAADFIGTLWLTGIWLLASLTQQTLPWFSEIFSGAYLNPFRSLPGFMLIFSGVALAGVCIYFFDKLAMRRCGLLTGREKHVVALTMAIVTAPWTFLIPLYIG